MSKHVEQKPICGAPSFYPKRGGQLAMLMPHTLEGCSPSDACVTISPFSSAV
jgi:hypothetical protein